MPKRKYTPEEIEYLHKYYSRTDNAILAARMSKPTTAEQIRNFACRHGLVKSKGYTEKMCVRRAEKMNETLKSQKKHSGPSSGLMEAFSAITPEDSSVLIEWKEGWSESNARVCLSRVNSINIYEKNIPMRMHGHYKSVDGYILVEVENLPNRRKGQK